MIVPFLAVAICVIGTFWVEQSMTRDGHSFRSAGLYAGIPTGLVTAVLFIGTLWGSIKWRSYGLGVIFALIVSWLATLYVVGWVIYVWDAFI